MVYFFITIVAIVLANLPFINHYHWGVIPSKKKRNLSWRLLEWFIAYFLVGGLALMIEKSQGEIYTQSWEFYVVTLCLFATVAFPGFVYRYLWVHE